MPVTVAEKTHPAAAPIRLPEFGNIEFGWGMCRNSMCPNFGVLYGSEEGPGGDDLRYKLTTEAGKLTKLQCRNCGLNISLFSSASLREIARYFLSLSLPFADCPTDECENHGVNAFEYFGRGHGGNRRPYRYARAHELTCKACGKSFPLGSPLCLQGTRKIQTHSRKVLHSVAMGRPVTDAVESGMKVASYYRQLPRMAARLRDYLAYRNAHLLRPLPDGRHNETALVYTDVLQAPLKRIEEGTVKGSQFKIIVSAVRLYRTYYVLAAHPYYLPESDCPDDRDLEADKEKPLFLDRRWDALKTFLDDQEMLDDQGDPPNEPVDEGQRGQAIVSPYAEAAHFLVVDRMLSRYGRRFYYMDTSRDLFDSAMAAMRDNIRRRRVEVVLYQHETGRWRAPTTAGKKAKKSRRGRRNEAGLRRAFEEAEAAFEKRINEESLTAPDAERETAPDPEREKVRSVLWRQARVGGNSPFAEGVWLVYPPDYKNYVDCRTFWITRRRDDTVDDGLDLLLNASMHSVDSAHWSMRSRAKALKRRVSTSAGKGLGESYYRFDVMCAELWVYLLDFNYRLRKRDKRKVPRAVDMGLAGARDRVVRLHDVAWNFRLGVTHAKEISRWLSRS